MFSPIAVWAQEQAVASGPIVQWNVAHDLSLPINQYPAANVAPHRTTRQHYRPPAVHIGVGNDSVVQDVTNSFTLPLLAAIGLNFDGIGNVDDDFPPDTNASVGDSQVVETVNTSYEVFDKASGNLAFGPREISDLFTGLNSPCGTAPMTALFDTDPIVLYDKSANRWLMSIEISPNMEHNDECIAISTTSDATGTYNRYDFGFGKIFPDFPKFGVWPDAYYASYNTFNPGAEVCAYDRAAMLAGDPAASVCFQLVADFFSTLPSDLDGSTPPPAGEPDSYIQQSPADDGNFLNFFRFKVDFDTPANSAFTGPIAIRVPAYTDPGISVGGFCVPQPGTERRLDSLAGFMNTRFAYRNFGDHESLVVNHNVKGRRAPVNARWYEIRDPMNPLLFQSGTLASGKTSLWLGSIAMDKLGDIALGFSSSSSVLHPSIQFTGRLPSDPLGRMESIRTIIAGPGSQVGANRWGDYSSMAIDPIDDCTFWYANEYLKVNTLHDWSTRLATVKFPGCQ